MFKTLYNALSCTGTEQKPVCTALTEIISYPLVVTFTWRLSSVQKANTRGLINKVGVVLTQLCYRKLLQKMCSCISFTASISTVLGMSRLLRSLQQPSEGQMETLAALSSHLSISSA